MSLAVPPKPRVINTKRNKLAIVAAKYNEVYTDALV
ncbi:MAG: 6,7-dimethyl-8-ribityllumazine synthase, partial [Akkermansiaceae bacterium]|nr:6,7-dimethyl-8-ribityllumazine synthase [Akkermansiaceae bacterium]